MNPAIELLQKMRKENSRENITNLLLAMLIVEGSAGATPIDSKTVARLNTIADNYKDLASEIEIIKDELGIAKSNL